MKNNTIRKAFNSVANFGFINYGADLNSSAMTSRLGDSYAESVKEYAQARAAEMRIATSDFNFEA